MWRAPALDADGCSCIMSHVLGLVDVSLCGLGHLNSGSAVHSNAVQRRFDESSHLAH